MLCHGLIRFRETVVQNAVSKTCGEAVATFCSRVHAAAVTRQVTAGGTLAVF